MINEERNAGRSSGQRLMVVPRIRAERPDRDLLDERYTAFRSAG
ncbi:hypothetical protein [Pseudonocardia sp. DSM 110487]|nr:hypothetical protein [Pseudonocardia sp. DSM 110487]